MLKKEIRGNDVMLGKLGGRECGDSKCCKKVDTEI
jgi:hypothetical protein